MSSEDKFKEFFQNILKLFTCCGNCQKKKVIIPITHCNHRQISSPSLSSHKRRSRSKPRCQSNSFGYKRSRHFEYLMDKYSSKYDHNIPDEIIERVCQHINGNLTTTIFVRQILKKERLQKYYEYSFNISQIINYGGRDYPPLIREYQKAEFCKMFQEPFTQVIDDTHRKTFLPYSYILVKFCELKGWNQIKNMIPAIKSVEKMIAFDKIWKNICQQLNWEFIYSASNEISDDCIPYEGGEYK